MNQTSDNFTRPASSADVRQRLAIHLREARQGVLKYLGAETDNALSELVSLLAPDFQQAADEAAAAALDARLQDVDTSPEALVQRLLHARANRPDPVVRKRVRRTKQAAPEATSVSAEPASSVTEDTDEDGTRNDWNA